MQKWWEGKFIGSVGIFCTFEITHSLQLSNFSPMRREFVMHGHLETETG